MNNRELANSIVSKVCETLNIDPAPKMLESLVDTIEQTIIAAQQRVHLTAIAVGGLALVVGVVVGKLWFGA